MRATHIANSEAPGGWVNVFPQGAADPIYANNLRTGVNLIKWSTLISKINDETSESTFDTNIRALRTALWVKSDQSMALAFHTLDGPTSVRRRSPKILVDAGIDPALAPQVTYPLPAANAVYKDLHDAVVCFGIQNRRVARLYLWVEGDNEPAPGDLIFPVFQYAINHELDTGRGECTHGVHETYNQKPFVPKTKQHRWCSMLKTWKLKRC